MAAGSHQQGTPVVSHLMSHLSLEDFVVILPEDSGCGGGETGAEEYCLEQNAAR